MRVHVDLSEEVREYAQKYGMKYVEVTREMARFFRNRKNNKILRGVQF